MNLTRAVLLSLGANEGKPLAQLTEAVERIGQIISLHRVSHVYRTEPVGNVVQPDFLNLACAGVSSLPATELLGQLLDVEATLGRTRTIRMGPRTIDIDLLAYGDLVVDSPGLHIPHPRLHLRRFVLVPLAEVAPDWVHPLIGKSVTDLLGSLDGMERVERLGRLPLALDQT